MHVGVAQSRFVGRSADAVRPIPVDPPRLRRIRVRDRGVDGRHRIRRRAGRGECDVVDPPSCRGDARIRREAEAEARGVTRERGQVDLDLLSEPRGADRACPGLPPRYWASERRGDSAVVAARHERAADRRVRDVREGAAVLGYLQHAAVERDAGTIRPAIRTTTANPHMHPRAHAATLTDPERPPRQFDRPVAFRHLAREHRRLDLPQ